MQLVCSTGVVNQSETVMTSPQVGRLLERDSKNYRATVELVYSSTILTVDYDDICEFTGDVED